MKKQYKILGAFAVIITASAIAATPTITRGSVAVTVPSPYLYNFQVDGTLVEAGSFTGSSSGYWWLNSGAYLKLSGGTGKTNQGSLPASNPWRVLYAASNPRDTDNGYHPQNIFRLVSRSTWKNFRQEVRAKIVRDNLSASEYRNGSNGILLFNRYKDGNNLYYTGIRVDGTAVVKKKKNGTYYTIAQTKVFSGTYNRSSNPNLLPKNIWLGIRSEVTDEANGQVRIKVFVDKTGSGTWTQVINSVDDGKSYGGSAITGAGYGGIRTDFMDVEFDSYRAQNL